MLLVPLYPLFGLILVMAHCAVNFRILSRLYSYLSCYSYLRCTLSITDMTEYSYGSSRLFLDFMNLCGFLLLSPSSSFILLLSIY